MKKEDKSTLIKELEATIGAYPHFYLTDIGGLDAAETSEFRRLCYNKEIKLLVVKNTLLKKALENSDVDYSQLYDSLKGETSLMLSATGNLPAKVIKDYSKKNKKKKPVLKAAYVEESFYIGANTLEELISIKSKNELLGEVIGMLLSPVNDVMSALQSGANTIHGVLDTLSERE
ncbi:MAG: 50S ribosomal protein L10 [Porphyromonadaceae bacterium]|jgi:large subunit ribosomal protein L10|nr:50S ribosomal protein L10 [Porphyromonadaceae bacterium]